LSKSPNLPPSSNCLSSRSFSLSTLAYCKAGNFARSRLSAGLLLVLAACTPDRPARPVERIAIVEFDNQTADPGAAQLGGKIARIATLQLAGVPDVFAYAVANSAEAPFRRATQLVTGYLVSRGGQWTLHAQLRDSSAHRTLRSFAVSGATPGALADGVAAQLGKPGFAAAKLDQTALESALNGGDTALLGETARLKLTPLPTDFSARIATVQRLSELMPADSETAVNAASMLMQARQFIPAAQAYQRARRADPDWTALHNEAAFGFAFAGDISAAVAAVEAYRKLEPRSANPDDSLGEIYFLVRRFDDSQRAFLAAFAKDPSFFGGATLRKAADARRASGNQPEADRLFARYAEVNAKRPLIGLEKAQWDYTSGRTKEALDALEAFAPKLNASQVWTQLAAWRAVNGGDAAGAAKLGLQTAKTAAEQQSAVTALFAAQPDASTAEWQARAAKQFPPAAAALAHQALVYALVLRKHWSEAIPMIAAQRNALPPATAGPWQALLAVALQESGQNDKAKTELRFAPIPRTVGDPTWDFLAYPKVWKILP
jgi:hypothetical protein